MKYPSVSQILMHLFSQYLHNGKAYYLPFILGNSEADKLRWKPQGFGYLQLPAV